MANYATGLTQNYEKAEQFYFNAIQLSNTNKTTLYLRLCEVYLRKKDYKRSLDFAQKILGNDQDNPYIKIEAQLHKANILKIQGGYLASKKAYQKIKEQLPPLTREYLRNPFINCTTWSYFAHDLDIALSDGTTDEIIKEKLAFINDHLFAPNTSHINPFNRIELTTNAVRALTRLKDSDSTKIDNYLINYPGRAPISITLPNQLAIGNYYYYNKYYDKAIYYYDLILDVCSKANTADELRSYPINSPIALETLIQKIKILRRQNPFKEATSGQQLYQHLEEAILLLDDLRQAQSTTSAKLDILKETDWVYKTAIETCYTLYQTTKEQKYLEQIYFLIEKSKSVLLADILNEVV